MAIEGDLMRISWDLLGMFWWFNRFPATPWFAHTQTTHANSMIYLSPEEE